MPRNPDLPRPSPVVMSKARLLEDLRSIDNMGESRARVLAMETEFRNRIATLLASLPTGSGCLSDFHTNPFVLMFYTRQQRYHFVSQIEHDIVPAKVFSSMETSAGRMVQDVVVPIYGWEVVNSPMQSPTSVIDARRVAPTMLEVATLKSGPRCLNDEMSAGIAQSIISYAQTWAADAKVDHVEITYAAIYGTPNRSNKKDWHILRNIMEAVQGRYVLERPTRRWSCAYTSRSVRVDVKVRHGLDWWRHLGGDHALLEILVALIRACVTLTTRRQNPAPYSIRDLGQIVSIAGVPPKFNVSLLQRSQIEWLFFLVSHFCDRLTD